MDAGRQIAYDVLDEGVPVFSADGVMVGTVEQVLAARAQDIFHGIVVRTAPGSRVVLADDITSLHERRVDLRIDARAVRKLAAAPKVPREERDIPTPWTHLLDQLGGHDR